jgi:hypothetical protein
LTRRLAGSLRRVDRRSGGGGHRRWAKLANMATGHDAHDDHGHDAHDHDDHGSGGDGWVLIPIAVGLVIGIVLAIVFGTGSGLDAFT